MLSQPILNIAELRGETTLPDLVIALRLDTTRFERQSGSYDSTLMVSYIDGAWAFEGGLVGISATRIVVMRPRLLNAIISPLRTSRALFAFAPLTWMAPASHICCARVRLGSSRESLRKRSRRIVEAG